MAQREGNHVPAGHGETGPDVHSFAFLVGMGICLALSAGFASLALERSADARTVCPDGRVNPNDAPVASLMRLPQIGRARARAIVAHREQRGTPTGRLPAFQTADDLRQIKGIGPAIVEDIRPWLQFDPGSRDGDEPPGRLP
jgi:competence ComEA-like helix-hairpin-helix protein